MKKTSMEIIIPADQDTVVKRVSRAVLGNTPPSKVIEFELTFGLNLKTNISMYQNEATKVKFG